MEKKYEILGNDTIEINGHIVYRIRALRTFGNILCGTLGGYIESEENLSHDGNCWIYENSIVFEGSTVKDNVCIMEKCIIYSNSDISGNAIISGSCNIYSSNISGDSTIMNKSNIISSSINGHITVCDNVCITRSNIIGGNILICGKTNVCANIDTSIDGSNIMVFIKDSDMIRGDIKSNESGVCRLNIIDNKISFIQ